MLPKASENGKGKGIVTNKWVKGDLSMTTNITVGELATDDVWMSRQGMVNARRELHVVGN